MSNYNPQKVKDIFTYVERLNNLRGILINDTINLEAIIDSTIAGYFCPDVNKRTELLALIVRKRLSFDAKISIFQTIIERHYKSLLVEFPNFITDLRKIKTMRNKIAHIFLHLDIDKATKNLEKGQVEYMDEAFSIKQLSEADINEAIKLAKYYITLLSFRILVQNSFL